MSNPKKYYVIKIKSEKKYLTVYEVKADLIKILSKGKEAEIYCIESVENKL